MGSQIVNGLWLQKNTTFQCLRLVLFGLEVLYFCRGGCRSNHHSCTQLWTSHCHCHGSWKLCSGSKAWNYRTIHSVFPHIVPQGYFVFAAQDTLMVSSKPSPAQAGKAGCFAHLLCFIHRVHMSFLRLNPGSTWSPWAVCQLFPRQWGFYPLFILCRLG